MIAGFAAEGYAHGSQNAAAVALLNQVPGNVGKTVTPSVPPTMRQLPVIVHCRRWTIASQRMRLRCCLTAATSLFCAGLHEYEGELKEGAVYIARTIWMKRQWSGFGIAVKFFHGGLGTVVEYFAEGAQLNIQQPPWKNYILDAWDGMPRLPC